jgi:hypothetical protein
MMHVA